MNKGRLLVKAEDKTLKIKTGMIKQKWIFYYSHHNHICRIWKTMEDPKTCTICITFFFFKWNRYNYFAQQCTKKGCSQIGKCSHLNGSTGSVSWRAAAAWKHSAASTADPTSLWRRPRWCQADTLVWSSRRASVRKLLTTAGDLQLLPIRILALETRLGTCVVSTSRASEYAFRASFSFPFASWSIPAFSIQDEFVLW